MLLDLGADLIDGERTAGSATLRDDAEGAGVIAAVLDRDEGTGVLACDRGGAFRHVPGARIELGGIGDQSVHLGHRGELIALDFGGAARHQQPRRRMRPARLADRLPGLADRFERHGAAVDHNQIARTAQHGADVLAFGQVEPAAERDHLGAHA